MAIVVWTRTQQQLDIDWRSEMWICDEHVEGVSDFPGRRNLFIHKILWNNHFTRRPVSRLAVLQFK